MDQRGLSVHHQPPPSLVDPNYSSRYDEKHKALIVTRKQKDGQIITYLVQPPMRDQVLKMLQNKEYMLKGGGLVSNANSFPSSSDNPLYERLQKQMPSDLLDGVLTKAEHEEQASPPFVLFPLGLERFAKARQAYMQTMLDGAVARMPIVSFPMRMPPFLKAMIGLNEGDGPSSNGFQIGEADSLSVIASYALLCHHIKQILGIRPEPNMQFIEAKAQSFFLKKEHTSIVKEEEEEEKEKEKPRPADPETDEKTTTTTKQQQQTQPFQEMRASSPIDTEKLHGQLGYPEWVETDFGNASHACFWNSEFLLKEPKPYAQTGLDEKQLMKETALYGIRRHLDHSLNIFHVARETYSKHAPLFFSSSSSSSNDEGEHGFVPPSPLRFFDPTNDDVLKHPFVQANCIITKYIIHGYEELLRCLVSPSITVKQFHQQWMLKECRPLEPWAFSDKRHAALLSKRMDDVNQRLSRIRFQHVSIKNQDDPNAPCPFIIDEDGKITPWLETNQTDSHEPSTQDHLLFEPFSIVRAMLSFCTEQQQQQHQNPSSSDDQHPCFSSAQSIVHVSNEQESCDQDTLAFASHVFGS